MWKKLKSWYYNNNDKLYIKFIQFILSLIIFVLIYFIIAFICSLFSDISKSLRWKWCYFIGTCKPVEFINEVFPAKTTKEIDTNITRLFDEQFVIFNVNSKVVHNDANCKYAVECTKNCIYMPKSTADKLISSDIAHNCKYEYIIAEQCDAICNSVSEKLSSACIYECINKKYNDEEFLVFDFLQELAEENVEEPDYDDYDNNYEYP